MISYEELIYNFTDIYLKTAMECSICKESYNMTDDTEFLDEYMKVFVSLLQSVESDDTLELSTVQETLEKRKREKILEFQTFLKEKAIEAAVESAKKRIYSEDLTVNNDIFIEEIQKFYSNILDDESNQIKDNPVELLRYMRMKEERI